MAKICINLKSKFISERLSAYLNKVFGNICVPEYTPQCEYLITEDNMATYNIKPSNLIILTQMKEQRHQADVTLLYYPLHIKQLLNTVYKLLNQTQNTLSLEHLKLIFSIHTKQLIDENNGKMIELTNKECLLLRALFLAYPQPISKILLLQQVWYIENTDVETFTLESHISLLRKKISHIIQNLIIIKNEAGYRLEIK